MPRTRTVLVVEANHSERERLRRTLEAAGSDVIACPGPTAPGYTCIGGREGYCPLIESVDVVVLDPWLASEDAGTGTSAEDVIELYTGRARTVVLLGSTGWLNPFIGGHVVALGDKPAEGDILAAVRDAPAAEGFVFRRS